MSQTNSADYQIIRDESGNVVAAILDGAIYRLAADAKITSPLSNGRVMVDAINATSGYADAGKLYSVTIDALTIGVATQTPFFLLKNPAGSGKTFKILEFTYSTDASSAIIRFHRDPTITTNGTALTPVNFLKSGAAAVGTPFRSSTVSAYGTLLRTLYTAQGSNNYISTDTARPVEANENFLISIQAQTSKIHYLTLTYAEI